MMSEIRVTANLQHPNILPLFDSGEADGALFYVMPFIAKHLMTPVPSVRTAREAVPPGYSNDRVRSGLAIPVCAARWASLVVGRQQPVRRSPRSAMRSRRGQGQAIAGGRCTASGANLFPDEP